MAITRLGKHDELRGSRNPRRLLARLGALSTDAAELFTRFGPTNKPPSSALFTHAPGEQTWQRELAGQTHLEIAANAALTYVRDTWLGASSKDSGVGDAR